MERASNSSRKSIPEARAPRTERPPKSAKKAPKERYATAEATRLAKKSCPTGFHRRRPSATTSAAAINNTCPARTDVAGGSHTRTATSPARAARATARSRLSGAKEKRRRRPTVNSRTVETHSPTKQTRKSPSSIRLRPSADDLVDQPNLACQPDGGEVFPAHLFMAFLSHPVRLFGIPEQPLDRSAEGGQISWIVDEETAATMLDLVLDPADPAANEGPLLPHRLGH